MSALKKLTDREREILQLIGRHQLSSKEAAQRAGIGYRRVNEICESAIRKLGVANRREALRLILAEEGLTEANILVAETLDDEGEASPRTESGVDPLRVPDAKLGGPDRGVFKDAYLDAQRFRTPPTSSNPASSPHAARSPHDVANVGRPGNGLEGIGLTRERALGERFRDGALERGGVPAGDPYPWPHPGRDRPFGRADLLSWVRGRARYVDLNPSQRIGAVLLMAAVLVTFVGWVLTAALQTSNVIQTLMPPRIHSVHRPWINLEVQHETIHSRH
jgi:DNA-binding CsgD family transcriptional regulator